MADNLGLAVRATPASRPAVSGQNAASLPDTEQGEEAMDKSAFAHIILSVMHRADGRPANTIKSRH